MELRYSLGGLCGSEGRPSRLDPRRAVGESASGSYPSTVGKPETQPDGKQIPSNPSLLWLSGSGEGIEPSR